MTLKVKKQEGCEANGMWRFSFCDGRSEEAKKLIARCEGFEVPRTQLLYERDKELSPLQLRLSWLNKTLSELMSRGIRDGELMEEQASVISDIKKIGLSAKEKLYDLWGQYREAVNHLHQEFKTRELVHENITTTIGRSVIAQRVTSDNTFSLNVNFTAVGDDNTAETISDATLGNETERKALSTGNDISNQAFLETFFGLTEAVDTHEEFGMFIDGSGAADSGQLLNRFTTTIVKTIAETMNVQTIITFNDA